MKSAREAARPRRLAGITIVECLVALTILSAVSLVVTFTVVAGHQHVQEGDRSLRAVRLGKDLLEEIIARPYSVPPALPAQAPGVVDRQAYRVGDYHGFTEGPGEVTDLLGHAYPGDEQMFGRAVQVTQGSEWIAELDRSISGVTVTVTVHGPRGEQWQFVRFIPAPAH